MQIFSCLLIVRTTTVLSHYVIKIAHDHKERNDLLRKGSSVAEIEFLKRKRFI